MVVEEWLSGGENLVKNVKGLLALRSPDAPPIGDAGACGDYVSNTLS